MVEFPSHKFLVATCGHGKRLKHLFSPCVYAHSNGQILIICRWDDLGEAEGDASNRQALYFSSDEGSTWKLSGNQELISSRMGSSFPEPSSVTHAWIYEDKTSRTWIYYTVNQPFTWGEGRPHRSTGGGEIRKWEIVWTGKEWELHGKSLLVWKIGDPLPDREGKLLYNIRVVGWNGLLRTRSGRLLMPIGGRETVEDPKGAYQPLDKAWVLVSEDDGHSWSAGGFMGGDASLCMAEPTIIETGIDNEIVGLVRVQYNTGNELYRVVSRDGGRNWSDCQPTGLPQCDHHGVKPFLTRLSDGTCLLIQTNEHGSIERTNIAIFITNDTGLMTDHWPVFRTLHVGNRQGWWPGSCYGWISEAKRDTVQAVWTSYDPEGGSLFFVRFPLSELLEMPAVEVNGVWDDKGNHRPAPVKQPDFDGESYRFLNVRGRLVATGFGQLDPARPRKLLLFLKAIKLPVRHPFSVLRFSSRNGRDFVFALFLDRSGWHIHRQVHEPLHIPAIGHGEWIQVSCAIDESVMSFMVLGQSSNISINVPGPPVPYYAAFGGSMEAEACEIYLGGGTVRTSQGFV
jgi:hypothetical protein